MPCGFSPPDSTTALPYGKTSIARRPRRTQSQVRVFHAGIQFLGRGHLRQEIAEHTILLPHRIPSGFQLFYLPAQIINLVLLPNIPNA
jgi:hypothetical protein